LRKISYFFIVFILGFCANTFAQNPYIRHYTTLDGLPTNTIYQIFQDSNKFIWFTSEAGVVKFDGSNFITFRKKDGLSSNDVVRIKEDFTGRIWIFSYNGAVNYIYNNKIYNGKNTPFLNSLLGKGFILDFFTDADHSIHFYNWQREVFSLDTNNRVSKNFLFKNSTNELPESDRDIEGIKVLHLNKNASGEWNIWSSIGVYKQPMFQKSRISLSDSVLHCMIVFPSVNKTNYVLTYSGKIIKVTGNFQKAEIPSPCDRLKIKTILEDSQGYLWIAAYDEGVFCLKNNKVIRHFDIKNALGLMQDHENNIWVSTQSDGVYVINHDLLEQNHFDCTNFDNHGLNQLCDFPGTGILITNTKAAFLLKNDVFYKLSVPKNLLPVNILYLYKDHSLLLGSISNRLYTFENLTLNSASKKIAYSKGTAHFVNTKKIIDDRSGNVATMFDQNSIISSSALTPSFNTVFNQISERINNAYYNANNELVINAKKNYLFRNNKLEPYPELNRFDGAIISDHLLLDDSAELFNIDGDSLYVLKNNKFYNLTDAFDTPFDLQINKMLYEDATLYLATFRDIFVCRNPMKVLSGAPLHLELLNFSFNNITDILIHKDTLYIASDDGLTLIAETSIGKSIALPPIPYLKSITVNNEIYSFIDQELKLTGKNDIHLSFGCISYSSSPIIYSYKLEGAENNWIIGTGSGINLVYKNLPKGNYVFKLRVRKSNSGWSKPLELAVNIKPTLVEYPAFWAFMVLIAAILFFLIISLIRNQKMKKVEVDHQLIVMEQKALQSMMNPHFIYNSLGSIQYYLLRNEVSEALLHIAKFARLMRQNLDSIKSPMIKLEEEVDRIKNYIDLEKNRLENKLDYNIEIDTELEQMGLFIPSMIIQPIVENSIWHGLAPMKGKGFITIRVHAYKPTSLKISIEDNGIGMKKSMGYSSKDSRHQKLGMQIIEKRLYLLGKKYNTETRINYSECSPANENPGTVVEIIMPFLYNTDDLQDATLTRL